MFFDNFFSGKDESPAGAIKKDVKNYEPWNDSFSMAVNFSAIATLIVWSGVVYKKFSGNSCAGFLFISGVVMAVAMAIFFKGMTREFGKAFEDKVVMKATKAFQGTGLVILPRQMTNVGDVDLLVRGRTGKLGNVEVKTWRYYGESDKFAAREKKALKQIHGQQASVKAHVSVLWLPQSSQGWLSSLFNPFPKIDKDVYLCCGSARKLRRLLNRKLN